MTDKIYHLDAIAAEVEAVTARADRVAGENLELRGRLRECRRANQQLQRDCAKAWARAEQQAHYWRQITVAAVGLAVALTCLLHTIILTGGGGL